MLFKSTRQHILLTGICCMANGDAALLSILLMRPETSRKITPLGCSPPKLDAFSNLYETKINKFN